MYTTAEFRDNLRQAFNDAEQGHEVVIERYGNLYQLVALVDGPLPGHSFDSVPKATPRLKSAPGTPAMVVSESVVDPKATETVKAIEKKYVEKKIASSAAPNLPQELARVIPQAKFIDRGLCKNGHLLNMRGRCDTKGCKYA